MTQLSLPLTPAALHIGDFVRCSYARFEVGFIVRIVQLEPRQHPDWIGYEVQKANGETIILHPAYTELIAPAECER